VTGGETTGTAVTTGTAQYSTVTATAACSSGGIALSGGYTFSESTNDQVSDITITSARITTAGANGVYSVTEEDTQFSGSITAATITAYVVCSN
jgi:hypothetical protein